MKQQVYEEALKAIKQRIESAGSTTTHDREGDRRRANMLLRQIAEIADEALRK